MGIKNDWMESQIEAIGQGLAAVLFGKEKLKKVFKKFEEKHQVSESQKMDDMLLDVLMGQYLKNDEFQKAEETLFSFMEKNRTQHMFMKALSFYNQLLSLDEEKLNSSGFSKEKIQQSIENLKQIYE